MTHPEMASGTEGDPSIWDELRLAKVCAELEVAPRERLLAAAKVFARAAIVTHPGMMRVMFKETFRAASGYSPAAIDALRASVTEATEKPS